MTLQQRIYIVIGIIVLVLITSFGFLIYYVVKNEEASILEEKRKSTAMMTQPILHSIYKDMLDERADMVYYLMKGIKKVQGVERIQIVRGNGVEAAFMDDKTLKAVEDEYGELKPEWKTPRLSEGKANIAEGTDYPEFKKAIQFYKSNEKNTNAIHYIEKREDKRLFTYLAPIEERAKCSACHKRGGSRGVIMISISLEDTYAGLRESRNKWAVFGFGTIAVVSLVLGSAITIGVTKPIRRTAAMLKDISELQGDLTKRLEITSEDELGRVGVWFNKFVEGMQEAVTVVKIAFTEVISIAGLISMSSQKVKQSAEKQLNSTDETASAITEMEASMKSAYEFAENMLGATDNMSASMIEMSASANEISGNMEKLSHSVETTTSSITEIGASVKNGAKNIETLSDTSQKIVSSITQIRSNIKEIEQYTNEQAGLAEEVKNYATSVGIKSVEKTIAGINRIRAGVLSTSEVVKRLGERSEAVANILNIINNVAGTTSLLALNASILASQAGKYGKGFAVVADETKNLAEQTVASTKEIAVILEAFHDDIVAAIKSIEKSSVDVEEGAAASSEAGTALEKISHSTDQTAAMARKIEAATKEQSRSVNLAAETIQTMRNMVEELKKAASEQRIGTEHIVNAAENMNIIARTVKTSVQQQARETKYTSDIVLDVAQKLKGVVKAIDEQKRAANYITNAVELMKTIGEDNVNLVSELDKTIEKLKRQATDVKVGMDRFKV